MQYLQTIRKEKISCFFSYIHNKQAHKSLLLKAKKFINIHLGKSIDSLSSIPILVITTLSAPTPGCVAPIHVLISGYLYY